ncbi:MAG: CsoS2 family carboxysome shell protein, partial [Granulosicoccaceae bacterium]
MAQPATNQTTRELVMARRKAMSTSGKTAIKPTAATTSQVSAPSTRTATNPGGSARDASRARREAMSKGGKASIQNKDRTRQSPGAATASPATPPANAEDRPKGGCGCGCNGTKTTCTDGPGNDAQAPAPMKRAPVAPMS